MRSLHVVNQLRTSEALAATSQFSSKERIYQLETFIFRREMYGFLCFYLGSSD